MNISNFIEELRRRNVIKVAVAYAIAGWLIIQIAATVFPAFEFPAWTTQFVIIIVGIGLPLSLIFAWAFELTPEGVQKSKEVDITESVTASTGKKLNGVIISVLSVAVFFLVIERVFFATSGMVEVDQSSISNASIAVLPFSDLSPNGDQEYFSDGLSEELLNVLTKAEEMRVAGRASSFKFKGQNENLKLIGAELDVDHILEGSVRKAGNTIRITAQLIKVEDGFQVWSETYDREYTAENVFRIQDEISQMVLNELKVRLLTSENSETLASTKEIPTSDIEAYEAYLKGNELIVNRKPDEIQQAIEAYERAIKIDPSFGLAYARLSIAYNLLYEYGNIDKEEVTDLIRRNADQAIFIDPSIAKAYVGLSRYYALKDDTENELKAIKKAHELSPGDSEIINWYAVTIQFDDRDKSDSLLLVAYSIDPLSAIITRNASNAYYRKTDYDKALELLDKNIEQHPDFISSYARKISLLRTEPIGKLDEAFIAAYEGYQERPEDLNFINLMITSAYQFDLDSLAKSYHNEILRLFPNNPAAENVRMQLSDSMTIYIDNKEFERAKAYAIEHFLNQMGADNRESFEKYLNNLESTTLFQDYFENKEYQQAFGIIQDVYPEYLTDTLTTHPEYISETMRIKYLFEQVGRDDLAENLGKLLKEVPFEYQTCCIPEFDEDIKKEETRVLYQMAQKYALLNQPKKVAEIVNEIHFVRNAKDYWWEGRWDDEWYQGIREHPDLAAVLKRVEEDKQRMKDNVIAFLKAEGEWREEWEVGNQCSIKN